MDHSRKDLLLRLALSKQIFLNTLSLAHEVKAFRFEKVEIAKAHYSCHPIWRLLETLIEPFIAVTNYHWVWSFVEESISSGERLDDMGAKVMVTTATVSLIIKTQIFV